MTLVGWIRYDTEIGDFDVTPLEATYGLQEQQLIDRELQ